MFKLESAKHKNVYKSIVDNYEFSENKTFGEMQSEIDSEYTKLVDSLGLSGYWEGDVTDEHLKRRDDFKKRYQDKGKLAKFK